MHAYAHTRTRAKSNYPLTHVQMHIHMHAYAHTRTRAKSHYPLTHLYACMHKLHKSTQIIDAHVQICHNHRVFISVTIE